MWGEVGPAVGVCAWPLPPDQGHGRRLHSSPPPPPRTQPGKTAPSPADRQALLLQPSRRTGAGMRCLCAEGGEPRSVLVPLLWDWTECLPTKLPEEKRCSPVWPSGPNIRKSRKRSPYVNMTSLPWQACCCSGPVCAVPAGAELCPGNSPRQGTQSTHAERELGRTGAGFACGSPIPQWRSL